MSGHTPEPWRASGIHIGGTSYIVASVSPIDGISNQHGEGFANARRIVACVNACAGIPTEALEEAAGLQAYLDGRIGKRP